MSNKYIIKNCPCIVIEECNSFRDNEIFCKDCTGCKLKQIVQVCNEYSDKWEDCDFSNGLAKEIFKLLDIQEVK